MKIAGVAVAAVTLSLCVLIGVIGAKKSFGLAGDIDEITQGMTDEQVQALGEEAGEPLPSSGRLKLGGVLNILGVLAAVALVSFVFVQKPLVPRGSLAVVGLCALAVVVYPSIETGPTGGMAPRGLSILATVLALMGAGGALLAKHRSRA